MRHTKLRIFYNYEKEEAWLNSLADQGLLLIDYFWIRYVFEDGEPGKYTYGIEFLEHRASHPASRDYLKFLEDLRVELIASYMHWVYLRKEKDGKPFALYTDLDSRIRKMKRISRWWFSIAAFEYAVTIYEVLVVLHLRSVSPNDFLWFYYFCILIEFLLASFIVSLGLPVYRMMKKLQKEKKIYEE